MPPIRRTGPVIAATAGGLALLANFHTHPVSARLVGAASSKTTVAALTESPSSTSSTSSVAPPARSRPTSPPTTAAAATLTGSAIPTKFGDVQVRATVRGHQIVDVQAIALPNSHQRSVEISDYVAPVLRSEALAAQSARIDLISGATYTSVGYARSLQSALDQVTP